MSLFGIQICSSETRYSLWWSAGIVLVFLFAPQLGAAQEVNPEDLIRMSPFASTQSVQQVEGGNTGAFVYTYDMQLPVGNDGLRPDFGLVYNSHNRTDYGAYGFGWGDTIPYISLTNKAGSERLYIDPVYTASDSGELVTDDGETYRAKVEQGSFVRFGKVGQSFVAVDKTGTAYVYGKSEQSRQFDVASTTKVYKWMLEEIRDPNGNIVTFSYTKDENYLYPETITYGGSGLYRVEFNLVSNNGPRISYRSGFREVQNKLIDFVEVFVADDLVKSYDFAYSEEQVGGETLASITEIGYESGVATELPPTNFSYTNSKDSLGWSRNGVWDLDMSDRPFVNDHDGRFVQYVDVNGDGLSDAVRMHASGNFYEQNFVALNTGNGWEFLEKKDDFMLAWPGRKYLTDKDISDCDLTGGRSSFSEARLVDVNGDMLPDVTCIENPTFETYLNTGSSWEINYDYRQKPNDGLHKQIRYLDINGDGLTDSIIHHEVDHWAGDRPRTYIYLNKNAAWSKGYTSGWLNSIPTTTFLSEDVGTSDGVFGDVNGDGLVDYIDMVPDYENETSRVWLNTGTSFVRNEQYDLQNDHFFKFGRFTQFTDLNGDGLVDMFFVHHHSNPYNQYDLIFAALNTGHGWEVLDKNNPIIDDVPGSIKDVDVYLTVAYYSWYPNGHLADINGDGLVDLVKNDPFSAEVYVNKAFPSGLLSEVELSSGGKTEVIYSTPQQMQVAVPGPFVVNVLATTTKITDGATAWSETYNYEDSSFYYTRDDYADRRFAGFGTVTKTTSEGKVVRHYHQGNGDNSPYETGDSEARIGLPYLEEVYEIN